MKLSFIELRHVFVALFCLISFGGLADISAQTTLNVTNYGAKGDLLTLKGVVTVSNSTSVVCSTANFSAGDINKIIEIFGAGAYEGQSNADLFVRISAVVSASTVKISAPSGASLTNATAYYGTDSYPGFTNAIANCGTPTATILIPSGNYFILPPDALSTNGYHYALSYTLNLHRGGISFAGQGNAILTGMGGWLNYNNQSCRSALFAMVMPMTNNYPLVFSNLTMDGGTLVGNIQNLSYPPSGSTGIGWDGTHHWMITVAGTGGIIDSLVMLNCTVRHYRGEMMEDTSGSANLFLTASNCVFCDGDASCINNFAHNCYSCTFSNANQAEEFYRTYTTNASSMVNCAFEDLNDGIALNGGYYGDPPYTIIGNTFTNFYGGNYALMTTPACDVLFVSNNVYLGQGLALGVVGYQGNTVNSNFVVFGNTFTGSQYPLQIFGNGQNLTEDVFFYSNVINNAWGIGAGYGWSTNVFVTNNTCINVGCFNETQFSGQYFLDKNNNHGFESFGNAASLQVMTNVFGYGGGRLGEIGPSAAGSIYALDDSRPLAIPMNATMFITNASSQSYPLYNNLSLAGSPNLVGPGQAASYLWNGVSWVLQTSSGAPVLSAISVNVPNLGTNPSVYAVIAGPMQLSATASANSGDAISWQWLESVNGGTQTVYSVGNGPNPVASLTNSSVEGGNTNLWTLQVTDTSNGLSAQSQIKLFIMLPSPQGIQVSPSGPP